MQSRRRRKHTRFSRKFPGLHSMWNSLSRNVKLICVGIAGVYNSLSRKAKLISAGLAAALVLALVLWPKGGQPASANTPQDVLLLSNDSVRGQNIVDISLPTPSPTPVPTPSPTPDPTLKRGMESEAVQQLQERLMKLGYLDIDESTLLYGPQTEAAVKQFQRQVNFTESLGLKLQEDGIAGQQTLELIYGASAPKYVVKYGMEGDDITDMQEQLKDLGYMSQITGYYGDLTVAAIKDFQSRNGLSADGLAGENTFQLLYSDDAKESASKAKQARTSANISKMIEVAKDQLGEPYVRGKRGPDSFDCSGLVYYCLNQAGSNRRRLNAAGYSRVDDWEKISSINSLKKGDLIFFYSDDYSKVGHVGIVINNSGEMVDASSSNGKVVRRSYLTSYWKKHFVCGRRPW